MATGERSKTPIKVKKIGHVVFNVSDVERSTRFWTEIMGFKVSDVNERGMVFLRNALDTIPSRSFRPGRTRASPSRTRWRSTIAPWRWEASPSCSRSATS